MEIPALEYRTGLMATADRVGHVADAHHDLPWLLARPTASRLPRPPLH